MKLFRVYVDGKLFYHPHFSRLAITQAQVKEDAENIDSLILSAPYNHPYLKDMKPMSSEIVQMCIRDRCRDIIRRDILPENAAVKTAVLYAVGVMFENRGTNEETEKMIPTLKNILSSNREEVF